MIRKSIVLKGLVLLADIFLLVALSASNTLATAYYVSSSSGNDSYNGTSESTPWKTIAKVNEQTFALGDTIKFKKGDTWDLTEDETLDVPSSQLTITYYGTGAKPLFIGSKQLVGSNYEWHESNGGTNECYVTGPIWSDPNINDPGKGVVESNYAGETPFLLWRGSSWKDNPEEDPDPHEPGDLVDHDWAYGDNDGLGFETLYIRDDSSKPGDPEGFASVKVSQKNTAISISDKSNVVIDGIDVRNMAVLQ